MKKQKVIPSTILQGFENTKPSFLRKTVLAVYKEKYPAGTYVKNISTGISIYFDAAGGRKTAMGGGIYPKKACLVNILASVLKHMVYSNWTPRKQSDEKNIIGYVNFKCKVKIDNKIENLRVSVRHKNNGKYYYSLEVNVYKK